jgi:hypothetical protein
MLHQTLAHKTGLHPVKDGGGIQAGLRCSGNGHARGFQMKVALTLT